jgi:hypothetical protein
MAKPIYTDEQVIEMLKSSKSTSELAREYGVKMPTIARIKAKGYPHICRETYRILDKEEVIKRKIVSRLTKTDTCWLYSPITHKSGYGNYGPNFRLIHRMMYEWFVGPIPKGMHVLHKCDVRACGNPDHLMLGTHLDNMRDRQQKNRQCTGITHSFAKLTEQQVAEIRLSPDHYKDLAKRYGISQVNVSSIKRGLTWKQFGATVGKNEKARQSGIGEKHPNSQLTNAQAKDIYTSSLPTGKLAAFYAVSPSIIYNIRSGKNYRSATGAPPRKPGPGSATP